MAVFPRQHPNTAAVLAGIALLLPSLLSAQQIDPSRYGELHFRHIGPLGNRVSSVAGVPGDRFTLLCRQKHAGSGSTEFVRVISGQ